MDASSRARKRSKLKPSARVRGEVEDWDNDQPSQSLLGPTQTENWDVQNDTWDAHSVIVPVSTASSSTNLANWDVRQREKYALLFQFNVVYMFYFDNCFAFKFLIGNV